MWVRFPPGTLRVYANTFVNGYHNLNVGNVTSPSVTGLGAHATYYYRSALQRQRHQREFQRHHCYDDVILMHLALK